jgi:hypothetical protein
MRTLTLLLLAPAELRAFSELQKRGAVLVH